VFRYGDHSVQVCITGPGMMAATYALTRAVAGGDFDFALQAGVAGSFTQELEPGELVLVQSEQLGDLGAEDRDRFLDIFELGLLETDASPFSGGRLECPLHEIPFPYRMITVNGLTVNTVSGCAGTVAMRGERFGCQVESMEGAAFHYVCLREALPFAQIRAISNYVEPRDRSKWKMKEAVTALNDWLITLLPTLPA
jgi:futalosine hydrolase